MTDPLSISVLLPVFLPHRRYSEVKWLVDAIRTAISQSNCNLVELVIVDDSGFQNLSPLIEDQLSARERDLIKILALPKNFGLIRSLNYALYNARGDLVARLDQDDIWTSGKLEKQVDRFRNDEDLALSFMSMQLMDENGQMGEIYSRGMTWPEAITFSQRLGCPIPHGTILGRKVVFQEMGGYGYSPASFSAEDFSLWVRMMRFYKVEGLSDIGLHYRVHGKSMSSTSSAQQRENSALHVAAASEFGDGGNYVDAISNVARDLGVNQIECGHLLRRCWSLGGEITVGKEHLTALRTIFFDRCLLPLSDEDGFVTMQVCTL